MHTRTKEYNYRQENTQRTKNTLMNESMSRKIKSEDKYFVVKKISDNNSTCVCGKCFKGANNTKCNCLCSRCEKCSYDRFHERSIYSEKSYSKKLVKWGEKEYSRGKSDNKHLILKDSKKYLSKNGNFEEEYDEMQRKVDDEVKYFQPNYTKFTCEKCGLLFNKENLKPNEEVRCRWGKYNIKCFCGMCDFQQKKIKKLNNSESINRRERNKIEIKFFKPIRKKYLYSVERKCICGGCLCGKECEFKKLKNQKNVEEDRKNKEDIFKRKREEEERKSRWEENKRKREEEERKRVLEEERRKREEERKKKRDEEERKKRLEEMKRKREEEERRRREEEDRKRREEERRKREEEMRRKREEEERRKKMEDMKKKLEEERRKIEEEEKRQKRL